MSKTNGLPSPDSGEERMSDIEDDIPEEWLQRHIGKAQESITASLRGNYPAMTAIDDLIVLRITQAFKSCVQDQTVGEVKEPG
jgi:hypothetical protein